MMQPIGAQGYLQPTPQASAVNIQIFDPKAYSNGAHQTIPNPMYSYPQQSVYAQPFVNQYQQYMPQPQAFVAPQYQPVAQVAPQPTVQPTVQPAGQLLAQPVTDNAQAMPAPVLTQNQPAQASSQEVAPNANGAPQNVNVVSPTQQDQTSVDVNALIEGLKSTDSKTQADAITKIASYAQGSPELQNAVLTEPVMKGLIDVVKQDTSGLQGPTEQQVAAINKAASGAQLTPEEEALTTNLAPKTLADKNRAIALYTLAILQKNQRDEIDRYNQTQDPNNQLPQIKINDLIGYTEMENAARNDSEKEVKLAAIQALGYIARPEDKQALEPVLTTAAQDTEPLIQQVANEALATLGSAPAAAQQAQPQDGQQVQPQEGQPQEVDLSKMSRKERRAYKKAQKEAEKAAKQQA